LGESAVQPRAKVLKRSNPTGIGKMWSCLHEVEEKEEDGVLSYIFKSNILESSRPLLWVRNIYPTFYDSMWKATSDGDDEHPVIVTGTSGIGKSFFGVYAALRAVREMKFTVVYTVLSPDNAVKRYVIAPSVKEMAALPPNDPKRLLLDLRERHREIHIDEDQVSEGESDLEQSMWWGVIVNSPEGTTFVEELLEGKFTWMFVDIRDGKLEANTKRLVAFVSDKPQAYYSFEKHYHARRLYMPVWKLDELKQANMALQLNIDEADLKSRYELVGGVPRSVLVSETDWSNMKVKVLQAIDRLEPNTLQGILDPGSEKPEDVASMLMHVTSTEPFNLSTMEGGFASKEVQWRIYNRFLLTKQFKLQMWLRYARGIVGGGQRGPKYEWFAHVVLGRTQQQLPIQVTELYSKDGVPTSIDGHRRGESLSKMLKQFAGDTRLFGKLTDLEDLKQGQYAQPLAENYPAIDAFCVFNGVPWEDEPSEQNNVLVLFQMTVAIKHPTLGQPIKDIITHVEKKFQLEKIILAFVIGESPLPGAEAFLTGESPDQKRHPLPPSHLGTLKRVEQVCLQIE